MKENVKDYAMKVLDYIKNNKKQVIGGVIIALVVCKVLAMVVVPAKPKEVFNEGYFPVAAYSDTRGGVRVSLSSAANSDSGLTQIVNTINGELTDEFTTVDLINFIDYALEAPVSNYYKSVKRSYGRYSIYSQRIQSVYGYECFLVIECKNPITDLLSIFK